MKRANTMKRTLLPAICLFALSCAMTPQGQVTFKQTQPLGQKSKYTIQNNIRMELVSDHLPGGSQKAEALLNATLETEVTATRDDGRWTVENRFTAIDMAVDGQNVEQAKALLANRPFSVTMDKTGKVLDVSGIDDMLPGMDLKEMMSQMNPTAMLPSKPVSVGESWPIEISSPMDVQGASFLQKLKGTGTLRELNNGQALIAITYTLEMTLTEDDPDSLSMSGTGKGQSILTYDMERARFTSNKTDMTIQSIGRERSGNQAEVSRSTLNSSMQVRLAGE